MLLHFLALLPSFVEVQLALLSMANTMSLDAINPKSIRINKITTRRILSSAYISWYNFEIFDHVP
ncbi:hypothetical protein THRCLA_20411 [Thraustotheca clavata]|uniref:Secreted protein n=1 Tax=Thraustotheca clavata TaxID=74557 RepID=A0A1W0A7P6_9STRA|nr:hypothetical protein THRCLA_20411 [Thraustotheca clavata]